MAEVLFVKGVHVLSRFGSEWELQGEPDSEGYVKAKRVEDGTERDIHLSDIKCVVYPVPVIAWALIDQGTDRERYISKANGYDLEIHYGYDKVHGERAWCWRVADIQSGAAPSLADAKDDVIEALMYTPPATAA